MPRRPRMLSSTGIYHVMIRGINRMDIFKTHSEKEKFLTTLARMKSEGEYTILGYCIMDNHVHLLIKEEGDPIARTMKRICVSYSYYYNKKYERIGPLFQGRFRSERIETEDYLLACLRYIHNNPVKASIAKEPSSYKWSSYNNYINESAIKDEILSPQFILEIFSENKSKSIKRLIEHTKLNTEHVFIDIEDDDDANNGDDNNQIHLNKIQEIIENYGLKVSKLPRFKDKIIRDEIIREIRDSTNLSLRQISKIIGLSKDTIARILK